MSVEHIRPVDRLREIVESDQVRDEVEKQVRAFDTNMMESLLEQRITQFREGDIYSGHVVRCNENEVVVDIGYKGEGFIKDRKSVV